MTKKVDTVEMVDGLSSILVSNLMKKAAGFLSIYSFIVFYYLG